MLQRLVLKVALGLIGAVIAITAMVIGISFLGSALVNALIASLGPIYGYLAAGGIILSPFLIATIVIAVKLRQAAVPVSTPASHTIARSLFSAVAREAPWIAAGGAAAVAAAEVFFNRKRSRP